MLYRKFIYTLLAIVLIGGLAGAVVLYRMLADGKITDKSDRILVEPKVSVPEESQVDSTERSEPEPQRTTKRNPLSFVENLIKNTAGGERFGSYVIKSIIADDANPESSRATIEDLNTGSVRTYVLFDTLSDNSKLVAIKPKYIILQKYGLRKRISFTLGGGAIVRNRPSAKGYREIGDNEFDLNPYQVFRGDADRILDFSMKIHSRDGNMDGIEISGVKNNTLAHILGLQDGDVLLEVNGTSVDSIVNSVKVCTNAYNSDDLQMKVRRGDRLITLTYHLFWEGQGAWTPGDVLNSKAVSSLFDEAFLANLF
jgi:hypothetical protein